MTLARIAAELDGIRADLRELDDTLERRDFTEFERSQSVENAALSLLWQALRRINNAKLECGGRVYFELDELAGRISQFVTHRMPRK